MSSFGTAFLTVFGVIFLVFRSLRFGCLTIAPNLLPVLAVLGVMGYLGISMNVATVMVASVALGVVDDDTIHFINRYRREVADGASTDEAIERATIHEGRASLTTAIINSCGFAVLLLSEYKPTAWFGGLLALTMAIAFLAEVFILPPTSSCCRGSSARRRCARVPPSRRVWRCWPSSAPARRPERRPWRRRPATCRSWPTPSPAPGDPATGAAELRARLFAEQRLPVNERIRFTVSGFAEGLLGRRPVGAAHDVVTTAIARVHEASGEFRFGRIDVYAGYGQVVWGRLDELQPTDVVNPLDVSRFFFEGRSAARLPVPVVRARLYLDTDTALEGVVVPAFRRGRFDQLEESTSPFNLAGPVDVERVEPEVRWSSAQGGARLTSTVGRVDWSVSAYRGFEAFPLVTLAPGPAGPVLLGVHPRFTMIGGDAETVVGPWGIRGEVAAFVRDSFQASDPRVVGGSSVDAGIGVDRRAGDYRLSGTVLFHREDPDEPLAPAPRRDVSFILSADRSFARERYQVRGFSVVNPSESSAFLRMIATAKLADDLALEASAGWFAGDGRDTIGRFADSDFAYARLKYYF